MRHPLPDQVVSHFFFRYKHWRGGCKVNPEGLQGGILSKPLFPWRFGCAAWFCFEV